MLRVNAGPPPPPLSAPLPPPVPPRPPIRTRSCSWPFLTSSSISGICGPSLPGLRPPPLLPLSPRFPPPLLPPLLPPELPPPPQGPPVLPAIFASFLKFRNYDLVLYMCFQVKKSSHVSLCFTCRCFHCYYFFGHCGVNRNRPIEIFFCSTHFDRNTCHLDHLACIRRNDMAAQNNTRCLGHD